MVPTRRWQPPLPSLRHELRTDPGNIAEAMKGVVELRGFRPLAVEKDFYQLVARFAINSVPLMSYASAPEMLSVDHTPSVYLVACCQGSRYIRTPLGQARSVSGGGLLLPAGSCDIQGSSGSVVIALDQRQIAATAATIAGQPELETVLLRTWKSFAPLSFDAVQARPLHSLIRHLETCLAVDPLLPARLGLDDVILRTAVALLDGSLPGGEPAEPMRFRERQGRSAFDDLIDYIRLNLHEPLRLSDLEARSHYSRRSLHYAFRERLGTTPKRWIRQQRLRLALQQLQESSPAITIKAIALACGYPSQSQFSAEFRRMHGLRPSEVQRAPIR